MPYQADSRGSIPITLVSSAARTTSSNTGNLKDTTTPFPMATSIDLTLDVTAYTVSGSEATGVLTVYLDHSPNGGTTWVPAARFTGVTTSTAMRIINFRRGVGFAEAAAEISSTTNGFAANIPLTRDVRVRWEIGDGSTSGTGASVTFAVYGFFQP